MQGDLDNLKDIAAVVGGAVGLITLGKAVIEYARQNGEKRAKQFLELRKVYRESPEFQQIAELLTPPIDGEKAERLRNLPYQHRFEYMAFMEDIAFLVNTGLMRQGVAFYWFGYDLIQAWENQDFWPDSVHKGPNAKYWSLLEDFYHQMKSCDGSFRYVRNRFRA